MGDKPVRLAVGKYDDLSEVIRDKVDADFAAVLVVGGIKGSGFSWTAKANFQDKQLIPKFLRTLADKIEEEDRKIAGN